MLGIGYRDAADDEPADVCLVNTCTVTAEGDAKSRQSIRQLARRNPGTRIVVMGCYATRAPKKWPSLAGVAEVVTDKRELPDLLGRFGVVDVPTGISGLANRQRAYVKVQDGCLLRCSFCIIPKVRPVLASRPVEHILDEIRRLQASGYREIVLTGIHLGHYGVEWNRGRPKRDWTRLSHLVERIAELDGDFRIRLSSIEATEVTRELIATMAAHPDEGLPSFARFAAKRFGPRADADAAALGKPAVSRPLPPGARGARRAGLDDRRDRRLSGRNRRRLSADLPRLRRSRFFQDPYLPVQPPPHHAGRRNARPDRPAGQSRPRATGWPIWKPSCASVIGAG